MIGATTENPTSVIVRDLNLNLERVLNDSALSPEEAHLALLAAATTVNSPELADRARQQLQTLGVDPLHVQEAAQSAALVGMLNVYYRFRHMLGSPEAYRTAGLRMTAIARPAMGKERFEMLAFAASVLNGCEACTQAHEKTLRDAGVSTDKIHDLARLAAVVKGISLL
jgi:alkyl hydroperoxide reductase subunit D